MGESAFRGIPWKGYAVFFYPLLLGVWLLLCRVVSSFLEHFGIVIKLLIDDLLS
jgi:hypothetical protein